jgi:methyl-accepting chemotaxis protein
MFNTMTIGKKIAGGFGIVLILLAVVGVLAYCGITSMGDNAEDVTTKNKLIQNLAAKEIDHLNWASAVNELLTNEEVTELNVQTDDHKCAFGHWLYGEGREHAERAIPELASILVEIEGCHHDLHTSAIAIKEHFKQADTELPGIIAARMVDHLKWADVIRDAFLENKDELNIQTDPAQCALGKWLNTEQAKNAYQNGDADFKQAWDKMLATHTKLHKSAIDIQNNLAFGTIEEAKKVKAQVQQDWDQIGSNLFGILESGMEDVIDPTKEKAEKSEDIAQMVRWGKIDMAMNEGVVQPFMSAHIAGLKLTQENLPTQWPILQKGIQDVELGIEEWATLVAGTGLQQTSVQIKKQFLAWHDASKEYHAAMVKEKEATDVLETANEVYSDTTIPLLHETLGYLQALKQEAEHEFAGMKQANQIFVTQTKPNLEKTQGLLKKASERVAHIVGQTNDRMLSSAKSTKASVSVISLVALVSGMVLAFLIGRGIVTALKRIIDSLSDGAEQVASASGQVSTASQSLAEGATEQAAGLEETSSSLEEMSSMTKQNADNAQQANTLATEARKAAGTGTESMSRMSVAINDIQKSSDETAKIIKVIDEIAFQTNLLALNAAVEAARAGEAGKGFAVVAEEVRNLAMRSAEAAKNTATMIEESVKNSNNGVDIAGEVSKVLDEIVSGIGKTSDLVSEIAAASQEQAQGIDQVNTAVTQMDKVTQQNAANAEESASASEELSAQAEQMNQAVQELVTLVGGATGQTTGGRTRTGTVAGSHGLKASDSSFHQIAQPIPERHRSLTLKTMAKKEIPLHDEEGMDDFNH